MSNDIPKYRRNEILKLYKVFHGTSSEFRIRREEFVRLLQVYYKWANRAELLKMFSVVYEHELEFQIYNQVSHLIDDNISLILDIFGTIDGDQNGCIDMHEFTKVFPNASFTDADSDGNGVLSVQEFVNFLVKNPKLIASVGRHIQNTTTQRKEARQLKLNTLFKSFPASPGSGWRPSLSDLKYNESR